MKNIFNQTEIFLEIGNHQSIRNVLFDKQSSNNYQSIEEIFKAYRNSYKYNKNIVTTQASH